MAVAGIVRDRIRRPKLVCDGGAVAAYPHRSAFNVGTGEGCRLLPAGRTTVDDGEGDAGYEQHRGQAEDDVRGALLHPEQSVRVIARSSCQLRLGPDFSGFRR